MATQDYSRYLEYKPRLIQERLRIKVAVTNRKGGVGKSSICANLAAELALRGYRVGIIDMDSQGQAAVWFRMSKENGVFRAMVGVQEGDEYHRIPLADLVRVVPQDSYVVNGQSPMGALYLLPSSNNTYRIPFMTDDPDLFGEIADDFMDIHDLDILLIDTAPTLSMLDGSIYIATDAFIHVTETETLSLDGLNESITQITNFSKRRVRRGMAPNHLLGIIPNKWFSRLNLHRRNLNNIGAAFEQQQGLVWQPVRHLKAWKEAAEYGMSVRAFSTVSDEALDVIALGDTFEGRVVEWLRVQT